MWQTLCKWFGSSPTARPSSSASCRPTLEGLEERTVLSTYSGYITAPSTYSNAASAAYRDLLLGYAEAAGNSIQHPNNAYARQGSIDSQKAFQYAQVALKTGSASAWDAAHRYAAAAELDEMRFRNTTHVRGYADLALAFEHQGAIDANNAAHDAPRR